MKAALFFITVGLLGLAAWWLLPDGRSEQFVDAQRYEVGRLGGVAAVTCIPLGLVWLLASL